MATRDEKRRQYLREYNDGEPAHEYRARMREAVNGEGIHENILNVQDIEDGA